MNSKKNIGYINNTCIIWPGYCVYIIVRLLYLIYGRVYIMVWFLCLYYGRITMYILVGLMPSGSSVTPKLKCLYKSIV